MPHHHHGHDHSSERIGWAFFLNVGFTIVEFIGGWLTNSTAIMADAVHDLGDSLSIGSAWILNKLGQRQPSAEFTYGYRRFSLFGALINSMVLIAGSVFILFEAIPRLFEPQMPEATGMFFLALAGVAVNGFAAWKLSRGQTLNEKILNWHLLEDVLGWVAILIVSVVLHFAHLPILDPLLSIGFTAFIVMNVAKNLWLTLKLFAQSVPDKALHSEIKESLQQIEPVSDVHHLHLWSLDGEHHVMTVHLVMQQPLDASAQRALKKRIAHKLEPYPFAHTTIELEWPGEPCRDHPI